MNDILLSGLLNLFALFGAVNRTDKSRSLQMLSNYLTKHFGVRMLDDYLPLYSDLRDFYDISPELDKDAIIEGICSNIKHRISREDQTLMLLRLMEFCDPTPGSQKGESISEENLQIFRKVAELFEVDGDIFEDFVIGGFAGCRKSFGYMGDRLDCWTTQVQADNFFVDTGMRDVRSWDCSLVGEIHDMTWGDLLANFAKKPGDIQKLRQMYHYATDEHYLTQTAEQFGYRRDINASFLIPQDTNCCRVIEVWNKERKARYHCIDQLNGEMFKCETKDKRELVDAVNEQRRAEAEAAGVSPEEIEGKLITAEWFVDNYWYYRFFAPTGEVLMEGETPYEHNEHPFVFRFYPFINGEIHSFVADVIDVQRYVNRLINLNDYLLRTSAKGLLAIPDSALEGTGLTIEDVADVWAKPGGVFVFKAKSGVPLPTQINNSVQNIGIAELISMEKQFFDEITGVNAALQGKSVGNVSGTYYAQQTQNAATSLQGILTAFSSFRKASAAKDCKNIQQYYTNDRIVSIVGRNGQKVNFNPSKVKWMEYDINISESTTSPVFRQVANDFLMQVWKSGQISLKTMLEAGAFPFGDKLLSIINAEEQSAAMAANEQLTMNNEQLPQ